MPHAPRQRRTWPVTLIGAGLLMLLSAASASAAQKDTPPPANPVSPQRLALAVRNSHLGYTYVGEGGIRYFVTQVELTNTSDKPVSVPIKNFSLLVDGVPFPPNLQFPKLTGYDFRVGGAAYRFRELERTGTLPLSPGTSGTAWVVFTNITRTQNVPQLDLRLDLDGIPHELDVTRFYEQTLQLQWEQIGPRDALGLLTINGRLNTISVGTLTEMLDQLAATGISRIVVGFGSDASPLDEPLGGWLRQTAEGVETSRNYLMFPAVTSTIRELHVAALPGHTQDVSAAHVHGSIASAVESALASAYRGLTPEEIVAQIEQGHRLARASALVNGGSDLPHQYLPLLLSCANSEDRLIRRGGFIAVSGSGDPQAIATLSEQASSRDRPAATLALECLAASRYAGAHTALEQLLDQPLVVGESGIVRILARYPRPHWADYLSRLALNDNGTVAADVQREVVLALGRIGHPQLTEILGKALQASDKPLQQTAFGLLLNHQDPTSEQLALDYALDQLSLGPPDGQMYQLFDRVRDPRVAPLLMPYLDRSTEHRTALINTLARIGPADIDDELANRYETFKPDEQAAVLTSLTQLRSPRLLALARSSLTTKHHSAFNAAVRSLGLLADSDAVAALAGQLDEETDRDRISTLAKALEDVGLPEAVRALEAARNTSSGDKRAAIAKRLQALRLQSPGGPFLDQADRLAQQDEPADAIRLYTLALQRDPHLAPAYSGRGHVHLKLEDYKQAETDFRQGIALDEDNGLAVAGLGITLAISGRLDEALQTVEQAAERFDGDLLFAYNAACVYGRALEHLQKQSGTEQDPQQIEQLQQAALANLNKSVELGFPDFDWMQQDPDLASLRHLEEFQKLATPEVDDSENGVDDPPPKNRPQNNVPLPQPGEQ